MDRINNLLEKVTEKLQQDYEGCNVKYDEIARNNGVFAKAFVGNLPNSNIGVTVYIDNVLERMKTGEMDVLDASEYIANILRDNLEKNEMKDVVKEIWRNPQKENIQLTVVNYEKNKEIIQNAPHRIVGDDLALVCRYKACPNGTILISNDVATRLGMTPSEVIENGIKNIETEDYEITPMASILSELMGTDEYENDLTKNVQMLVVSNQNRVYGAAGSFADISLREQLHEQVGDFYIIPSSIHECIVVPASMMGVDEVNEMIQAVNETQLEPEEVLADHVYFVGQSLQIENPMTVKEVSEEKMSAKASMRM